MPQQQESSDFPRKSMAGKYDGRKHNGATKKRRRMFSDLGRRTNWAKHLEKTDISRTLRKFDDIATPEDIYRKAWEDGDLELCAGMYKQFQDRLLGRPFIATNPAETQKQNGILQDNRLQLAIQQYIVQPMEAKRLKKIGPVAPAPEAKQLPAA